MTKWVTRRRAIAAIVGAATAGAGGRMQAADLIQPDDPGPNAFSARAFALRGAATAAGDQPYGAVVVLAGRIIGEAPSRVVTGRDPTAHAEMEAIRDALRRQGTGDLAGAVLYSSSRPCPMCEAAASYAGIGRMIHGRTLADAGAPRIARC